jgi:DNA-binding NarL/FixJ family response regulator
MVNVLVLDRGSLCEHLRKICAPSKLLTFVHADSKSNIVEETKSVGPRLVVLNVAIDRFSDLLGQLHQTFPILPIFVFADDYDFNLEHEALLAGATAVFSGIDEPSSILANVEAVCAKSSESPR